MGSCNSCLGSKDDMETNGRKNKKSKNQERSKEHRGASIVGQSSLQVDAPSSPQDDATKRALIYSATEDRIKQIENRGGGGDLSKKLASQSKSTSSAVLEKEAAAASMNTGSNV